MIVFEKTIKKVKVMRRLTIIGLILGISMLAAATTGKLTGVITDSKDGVPLVGCNIMLLGTDIGAATDANGEYIILNIPPGYYDVRAMMIGYEMMTVKDVVISIDKTTRLPLELSVEALEGEAITVTAGTKTIQFDVTNSEARVTGKDLEVMPVTDVSDVIKLQGGITQDSGGGIHIRGGRSSEVVYMVDGVSMTDVYNGGLSVNIENSNIQELQVISGTFNAEYGKAMSGIINMVTKDGGNEYQGGFKVWSGDHTTQDDIFRDLDSYSLTNTFNLEANFSGPLIKDRVTFYSSARYFSTDGYLNGLQTFTQYGDTLFNDLNGNRFRDTAEDWFDSDLNRWIINGEFIDNPNAQWDIGDPWEDTNNNGTWDTGEPFSDVVGNGTWDRGERFVWDPEITAPVYNSGEAFRDMGNSLWEEGESYTDVNGNGQYDRGEPFADAGDGSWTDAESYKDPYWRGMNWLDKYSLQNKVTLKLTPQTKLKFNHIYSYQEKQDYDHGRQMCQEGRKTDYDIGDFKGINLSHSFNSRTFFDLNISEFSKKYESYLYENSYDSRYITPDSLFWAHTNLELPHYIIDEFGESGTEYNPEYSFGRWGVDTNHFKRQTVTQQLKFDLTSQIDKYNQVKLGFDYQKHTLEMEDKTAIDLQNDQIFDPLVPVLININDTLAHYELQEITGNLPSWVEHMHIAGPFFLPGNYYKNEPVEFSAYIQDKIEYGDMIVNVGLRYDYFDPNSFMPTNIHDPFFYNPQDPRLDSLMYFGDYDSLNNLWWGQESYQVVSIDGQDTTIYTFADFGGYSDNEDLKNKTGWWRETKTTSQISPRLGIAYPISDKGVIHFSYGYFFKIPQFEYLYTNPGYFMGETEVHSGLFGNPELKPQRTVSYELGIQQELARNIKMEMTGYYRDVRDWVATGVPISLGISGADYFSYTNKDYSNVRGIILSLDKTFGQGYSWHVDYTFQIAEGSNSDPGDEYAAISGGDNNEPMRFIVPLNWDQRHTFNADFFVGNGTYGADLLMQYGSGYPYTPEFNTSSNIGQNVSTNLPTNSRRKPVTVNFDLKMFYNVGIVGGGRGKVFMNIYNLFDRRNENTIWADTGRANKTQDEERAYQLEALNPQPMRPNTIDDFYNHPEYYSAPRNIQLGFEVSW